VTGDITFLLMAYDAYWFRMIHTILHWSSTNTRRLSGTMVEKQVV